MSDVVSIEWHDHVSSGSVITVLWHYDWQLYATWLCHTIYAVSVTDIHRSLYVTQSTWCWTRSNALLICHHHHHLIPRSQRHCTDLMICDRVLLRLSALLHVSTSTATFAFLCTTSVHTHTAWKLFHSRTNQCSARPQCNVSMSLLQCLRNGILIFRKARMFITTQANSQSAWVACSSLSSLSVCLSGAEHNSKNERSRIVQR